MDQLIALVHGAIVAMLGWIMKAVYAIQGRLSRLEQRRDDDDRLP